MRLQERVGGELLLSPQSVEIIKLVILGVVARMFRCAPDHPAGAPDRHPGPLMGPGACGL